LVSGDQVIAIPVAQGEITGGSKELGGMDSFDAPVVISVGEGGLALAPQEIQGVDDEGLSLSSNSVSNRKTAALLGLEYMYSKGNMNLHFQAMTDVSGVHQGSEARIAAIFPFEFEQSSVALSFGLDYQSIEVLDYYYGVDREEVDLDSLVFNPKSSGVGHMFRLDWQRPISRHWSLRGMYQYRGLTKEIHNSPLLDERSLHSIFIGGVYHF